MDIIFGEDPDCVNADQRYVNGLDSSRKQTMLIERRFSLIIRYLLEKDNSQAARIFAEHSIEEWNSISLRRGATLLGTAASRFFGRPVSEVSKEIEPSEYLFANFYREHIGGLFLQKISRHGALLVLRYPAKTMTLWCHLLKIRNLFFS